MVNTNQLMQEGYTILNGQVMNYVIAMNPENVEEVLFTLILQGDQWSCRFGNFSVDSKKIAKIMQVMGVTVLDECKDKTVRIAVKDIDTPIIHLGHIIYDNWYVDEEPVEEGEPEVIDFDSMPEIEVLEPADEGAEELSEEELEELADSIAEYNTINLSNEEEGD